METGAQSWMSLSGTNREILEELINERRVRTLYRRAYLFFCWILPVMFSAGAFLGLLIFYAVQYSHAVENLEWTTQPGIRSQGFPTPSIFVCVSAPFVAPLPFFAIGSDVDTYTNYGIDTPFVTLFEIREYFVGGFDTDFCAFMDISQISPSLFSSESMFQANQNSFLGVQVSTTGILSNVELIFLPAGKKPQDCFNQPWGFNGTAIDLKNCMADLSFPNLSLTAFLGQITNIAIQASYFSFLNETQSHWVYDLETTTTTLTDPGVPNPSQTWQGEMYFASSVYLIYKEQHPLTVSQFLVNLTVTLSVTLSVFHAAQKVGSFFFFLWSRRKEKLSQQTKSQTLHVSLLEKTETL